MTMTTITSTIYHHHRPHGRLIHSDFDLHSDLVESKDFVAQVRYVDDHVTPYANADA